jgi:hypothetical protein
VCHNFTVLARVQDFIEIFGNLWYTTGIANKDEIFGKITRLEVQVVNSPVWVNDQFRIFERFHILCTPIWKGAMILYNFAKKDDKGKENKVLH